MTYKKWLSQEDRKLFERLVQTIDKGVKHKTRLRKTQNQGNQDHI